MPKKTFTVEQIILKLRQIEVLSEEAREADIIEQTNFRCRKQYGGMRTDGAKLG